MKSLSEFESDDLMPLFIYCGVHYFTKMDLLKHWLRKNMSKYGIKSSVVTMLHPLRWNLVTKEKAKAASEGKLINEKEWKNKKLSVNDDLEVFLSILQNKEIKDEKTQSFLTEKLTNEELNLVKERNQDHLNSYMYHYFGRSADVSAKEMKKSNSTSKYVNASCCRVTFGLNLEYENFNGK